MADTVTSQTIQDDDRNAVLKFTNVSDGTGESAVKKVDVSALAKNSLGQTCTKVSQDYLEIAQATNIMIVLVVYLITLVVVLQAILTLQL
jgi:hypothetical protein